ncbi:hydroxyacid dehydrogenase [Lachnotalea glycerini]|jgi:D-3-phosphoglycerate dehydrogenase / 2-oxoglutarate reductase|uniref:Hydroxyacid dehydrogenase n=2 Tax=Lachnotalea glycerini TaxID=1763509 RepID=A0A371JB69_9FIRM|nr:hydroxyacid dehydrogenase [Lachnotalea glycerini]
MVATMKRIVSFFGDDSDIFQELNKKADAYAASLDMEYEWIPQLPFSKDSVIQELKKSDAGIIDIEPYDEDIFSKIEDRAKILVRFGVGFDKVDLETASKHGIAIARTTGANTTAVAEMALTLMLACKRLIIKGQKCVMTGNWVKDVGHEIINGTVGIIGFGVIGRRLAKLLSGFDCRIVVYDPYPNLNLIQELGVELLPLDELLQISDAISIHVPLLKETTNMIGRNELKLMKESAVLVNTSRGGIVDENALYEALSNGVIAGAGFDVFAIEPLPLDSPLLKLENVILTPHVSSQTVESLWNIYKMAIDIVYDFYHKKDFSNILNPDYINADKYNV